MPAPTPVSIAACLPALDGYDAILDARSPAEFAHDHIPGASSTPVLDDAERAEVGTLQARAGAFAARRRGAALVSRNIAALLDTVFAEQPANWRPLVYCWRGGNRSGSLATVLARIGWHVDVLEGGYRAYRRHVLADLEVLPVRHRFIVIAGRTGVGKSRLLHLLAARGQQVLDLEALAAHRGSILGPIPDQPQPSQKAFESAVWDALRRFDQGRPVFVESESRKIGQRQIPGALIERIRNSDCLVIRAPTALRLRILTQDYEHFLAQPDALVERLAALRSLHGRERVAHWQQLAREHQWDRLVEALLASHYDPAYDRSIRRNFARLDAAATITLDGSREPAAALAAGAAQIAMTYGDEATSTQIG